MKLTLLAGGIAFFALCFIPVHVCKADDRPVSVQLSVMANLYEPVIFDHAMHVEITESKCASCHHHTLSTPASDERCVRCHNDNRGADKVACGDCHVAERFAADYLRHLESSPLLFHVDKPGLRGAFHRKCLGCHTASGAPTGCQDCHRRNDKGDAFYRAGKYAPEAGKVH